MDEGSVESMNRDLEPFGNGPVAPRGIGTPVVVPIHSLDPSSEVWDRMFGRPIQHGETPPSSSQRLVQRSEFRCELASPVFAGPPEGGFDHIHRANHFVIGSGRFPGRVAGEPQVSSEPYESRHGGVNTASGISVSRRSPAPPTNHPRPVASAAAVSITSTPRKSPVAGCPSIASNPR